jgi:hypothetical protein
LRLIWRILRCLALKAQNVTQFTLWKIGQNILKKGLTFKGRMVFYSQAAGALPQRKEREMTDTRFFKTIAVNRTTGEWKVFYGFFPQSHHDAARRWLAA